MKHSLGWIKARPTSTSLDLDEVSANGEIHYLLSILLISLSDHGGNGDLQWTGNSINLTSFVVKQIHHQGGRGVKIILTRL